MKLLSFIRSRDSSFHCPGFTIIGKDSKKCWRGVWLSSERQGSLHWLRPGSKCSGSLMDCSMSLSPKALCPSLTAYLLHPHPQALANNTEDRCPAPSLSFSSLVTMPAHHHPHLQLQLLTSHGCFPPLSCPIAPSAGSAL